jgi:nucleoside-diphosphate-sugar epimerase
MKYLVTGADGFLGRHFLTSLAERGIAARAMLQRSVGEVELPGDPEIVRAELLEPDSLAAAVEGITHVVHLAARVHVMPDPAPDPEREYFRVNVEGTRSLLAAAAQAGVTHFLLMSTVKAMGEEDEGIFDETSPPAPTTPYGRSKLAAEEVVFELAEASGVHACVTRLPMVYGPGAKGNVLRLLEAARRGKRLPFGAIENRRSMAYVRNVVDAALAALASPDSAGQVYLVCDERPYSTREFYSAICRAMGKEPLLRNTPVWLLKAMGRCGDLAGLVLRREMPINTGVVRRIAGDLCFSARKITEQVGFTPKVSLAEGAQQTVRWYLETQAK